MTLRACRSLTFPFAVLFLAAARAPAQPTYKLDVKPELKPRATLTLEGRQVVRSPLSDDPGFRLQYHFRREGKTVAVVEARSQARVDVPLTEPGRYTVTLELFYPAYKGGAAQKGEFKAVSGVLTYRIEAGEPAKIVVVAESSAALKAAVGIGVGARR